MSSGHSRSERLSVYGSAFVPTPLMECCGSPRIFRVAIPQTLSLFGGTARLAATHVAAIDPATKLSATTVSSLRAAAIRSAS